MMRFLIQQNQPYNLEGIRQWANEELDPGYERLCMSYELSHLQILRSLCRLRVADQSCT